MSKILIVEDSSSLRSLLKTILTIAGYEVAEAGDGEQALSILSDGGFDLLITDLNLPGMDGIRFITAVQKLSCYQQLPILVMSGDPSDKRRRECLVAGASEFLQKPFKGEVVLGFLRMLLK